MHNWLKSFFRFQFVSINVWTNSTVCKLNALFSIHHDFRLEIFFSSFYFSLCLVVNELNTALMRCAVAIWISPKRNEGRCEMYVHAEDLIRWICVVKFLVWYISRVLLLQHHNFAILKVFSSTFIASVNISL